MSTSNSTSSDSDLQENCYQAILKSLDGGCKCKHNDPLDSFTFASRFFPLNYDPYVDFGTVLQAGIAAEFEEAPVDDLSEDGDDSDWVKTVPRFSELITKFESNLDALANFIDTMVAVATGRRTDNTGSLKYNGLMYILKDPNTDKMDPLMPKIRNPSKANRGWNHQMIACHLCPAHDIDEFNSDPQAYMDLVHAGFLCGYALLRTWCHIFTGPTSAIHKNRKATKPSKGHLHGLQEPNIRNIMYVAIQLYFALSNESSWMDMISMVDLTEMFHAVVQLVECKAHERWVHELMKFWKSE
ncbi:hypothetical protein SCLCIDRAFT_16352 [Scleroderma citrinum Foug A]|uniref:Fungal-type protein kinase domain-containing protein n=1 Tax=Scleroderma citrinum Foug A TaxID=1036808 RepID=A0A0C3DWC6_9AGAM|nr:hypothetical protein SCLCIDRAFT_16352 [Scleroderma citrinum Foug A]